MGKDDRMRTFITGMIVGLVMGSSMGAIAASVFGNGPLTGWSVTKDGEEVCTDPGADLVNKEIECD